MLKPGGVFVRRGAQMADADKALLRAAARSRSASEARTRDWGMASS